MNPVEEATYWELEGVSMLPSFAAGDVVWAVKLDPRLIRFWDVVLFQRPGGGNPVIMHRVWRKKKLVDGSYEFRTKGDSCPKWDLGIRSDDLLGVGIAVLKQSGWLFLDRWPVRIAHGMKAASLLPSHWAFETRIQIRERPTRFWRCVRWILMQLSCSFVNHADPWMSARRLRAPMDPNQT